MSRIIIYMELKLTTIAIHFLDKLLNFLQVCIANIGTYWKQKNTISSVVQWECVSGHILSANPPCLLLVIAAFTASCHDVRNLRLARRDAVRYADTHRLHVADQ